MAEVPLQSPTKYGKDVYDDIDRLADMLDGGSRVDHTGPDAVPVGQIDDSLAENVLREALNSTRKYGG